MRLPIKETTLTTRFVEHAKQPDGTHTLYLVVYGTGAVTCDVHEMIDRHAHDQGVPEGDPSEITGTLMIVPDGDSPIWVEVEDVNNDDGFEWEITQPGATTVLEYVLYEDRYRTTVVQRAVYVQGFPAEPTYPQMQYVDA